MRIRCRIDGELRYASFGLYADLDDAKAALVLARQGRIEPRTMARRKAEAAARRHEIRRQREIEAVPRFTTPPLPEPVPHPLKRPPVSRPGTAPPNLTLVSTKDLINELRKRGHPA